MRIGLRHPWDLLLLGAASFAVTYGHAHLTRPLDAGPQTAVPTTAPPAIAGTAVPTETPPAVESPAASEPATAMGTEVDVDALLASAVGENPATRLAAIEALASAPRERTLPVLVHIAEQGAVEIERHAALGSLHSVAERQGDPDGAIHGLLRDLIHDGNDETVSGHASTMLEELDQTAPL